VLEQLQAEYDTQRLLVIVAAIISRKHSVKLSDFHV
jgi:hypothetical protein